MEVEDSGRWMVRGVVLALLIVALALFWTKG